MAEPELAGGSAREQVDGEFVRRWLAAFAEEVARRRDELTELDAAIGDADHGINLDSGLREVASRLASTADGAGAEGVQGSSGGSRGADAAPLAGLLHTVGMTLLSTVGGAAGPLYGSLFLKMAGALDQAPVATAAQWCKAWRAGVGSVQARGRSGPGDKTMLDALLPAVDALEQRLDKGEPLLGALEAASAAAHDGMVATVPMVARKGRASYLGERSAGHQDPGATSAYMLVAAAARTAATSATS